MTLVAFAAVRHAAINRYLLLAGPLKQSLLRQTDGRTPYRFTDPATYYVGSVNNLF